MDNGPGVIRDRLAYMDCSSGNRVGCETRWLASDRGRHARLYRELKATLRSAPHLTLRP